MLGNGNSKVELKLVYVYKIITFAWFKLMLIPFIGRVMDCMQQFFTEGYLASLNCKQ